MHLARIAPKGIEQAHQSARRGLPELPLRTRAAYKVRVKNDKPRSVLGLVFLTVFIDLVGFSIIFPSFPAMLDHYMATESADGVFGRLLAQLSGWVADSPNPEFAVVVLFGGVLGSVYSLLQFVGAPFWGNLSDRIGRRGTLLFTLGGTAASYLI